MMTDPLSDMLARLRNAAQARHESTEIPVSRLKLDVANLLKAEGYISDVSSEGRTMTVRLKYGRDRAAAFVGCGTADSRAISRCKFRGLVVHRTGSARVAVMFTRDT